MRTSYKSVFSFYLQMILAWIVAMVLFAYLRNYGIDHAASSSPVSNLKTAPLFLLILIVGVLAGIVYSSLELLFDRPFFQRHSYGRIILGKLLFFFLTVKIIMLISILIMRSITGASLDSMQIIQILRSKIYWVLFVYFLIIGSAISFIRMVSQKFGPGILWNMFIGRYRNPREEVRVFMFLDLKSSTTIAEKLGHIKFSRLLQNCFADLTNVIHKHKVEIYQYVGDEAVLSWPIERAFEQNHCIHSYYDYMEELNSKAEHYKNVYGLQPVFKAGVHLGKVIVAEVGLIKREIAYHGDVLNTTARIQSKCNDLQQKLLISQQVMQHIEGDGQIAIQKMGEELLKGKKNRVTIYGVSKKA